MDAVVKFLQPYQLHPVVDHFSVALLFVAVLIDLFAGGRIWLRYTAVLLMILGALAAGGSYLTGDMEADRIWNALGQPAREVLHRHAQLGDVSRDWLRRIRRMATLDSGVRLHGRVAPDLSHCRHPCDRTLGYQAHLGGVLVYDYGAGTALMASAPVPSEGASPAAAPSSSETIPMVSVPTPMATSTQMATP